MSKATRRFIINKLGELVISLFNCNYSFVFTCSSLTH